MIITIIDEYKGGIQVEVEEVMDIRPGKISRINPSEGYMGIESGVIEVQLVVDPSNVLAIEEEYPLIADRIRYFSDVDSPEERERLDTGPWIIYKYSSSGDIDVLPLQEFIQHTMIY